MPLGQCQAGFDRQAVAVLHQPMSHESQFGLLAFTLAIESGVWIDNLSFPSLDRMDNLLKANT